MTNVAVVSRPTEDRHRAAADNLLINCARIERGSDVLFVNESGRKAVSRDTVAFIENRARDLGANVKSIWLGAVAGPESIPDAIIQSIKDADVSIFNHTLGAMLRIRPVPGGGIGVLNYATTDEILASDWVQVPYELWQQVVKSVAGEFGRAHKWRIICPNGTDISGEVPETERSAPAASTGFSLHTFPIGTHRPTSALTANGKIAIRWLVSSQNHDVGEGLHLDHYVIGHVQNGRFAGFEGRSSSDAASVKRYLTEIGERYGQDPFVVNSWHGGINPQAFTPRRDIDDLAHWQTLVHNNPRSLHFHVIGDDVPGELSLPIIDHTVAVDGEVYWDKGRFSLLDRPAAREAAAKWDADGRAFHLNNAIGI
jgi:hypothetical protein